MRGEQSTSSEITALTNLTALGVTPVGSGLAKTGSTTFANVTMPGGVSSVNDKTGTVVLTTSDIAEGANLYFTLARVLSAVHPSGSNTQVQFNDGGSFGGDADFTWDKTNSNLYIGTGGGTVNIYPSKSVTFGASSNGLTPGTIQIKDQATADTKGDDLQILAGLGKGTGVGGTLLLGGGYNDTFTHQANVIISGTNGNAVLDTDSQLSGANKTFTFPNRNGTFIVSGDTLSGDITGTLADGATATTLASVIAAGGPTGSATVAPIITYDAKGRLTAVSSATITPAASSITGAGDLTRTNDTNVTLTLGGTPTGALLKATSLTLGWSGTLAVSRGGTGGGSASITLFNNITGYTAAGATGTTSTNLVFSTSPVLTTPDLGTPSALVGTNITGTGASFTAGKATILATARTIGGVSFDGSANITVATATGGFTISGGNLDISARNIVTDTSTGTKFGTATNQKISFYNSAPIVQPTGDVATALSNLGLVVTPTIIATTNANLTGPITSVGNATSIASQTGTGTKFVVDTSPTLVTPNIGAATGTSLNLGGATLGSNLLAVNGSASFVKSDASVVQVNIQDTHADGEGSFVVRNDNYYTALEVFGSNYSNASLRNVSLFTSQSGIVALGFATLGSAPLTFLTNGINERMRVSEVGNVKIGGTASRGTTEGTVTLSIFNGTAPAGTLTNGASFFCAAGEMKVIDSAGNVTLLSPHEKGTNNWIYDSVDTVTGKHLKIDVEKMFRFLNQKFGTDFIHEYIETT